MSSFHFFHKIEEFRIKHLVEQLEKDIQVQDEQGTLEIKSVFIQDKTMHLISLVYRRVSILRHSD